MPATAFCDVGHSPSASLVAPTVAKPVDCGFRRTLLEVPFSHQVVTIVSAIATHRADAMGLIDFAFGGPPDQKPLKKEVKSYRKTEAAKAGRIFAPMSQLVRLGRIVLLGHRYAPLTDRRNQRGAKEVFPSMAGPGVFRRLLLMGRLRGARGMGRSRGRRWTVRPPMVYWPKHFSTVK